jgi:hypothetical protein
MNGFPICNGQLCFYFQIENFPIFFKRRFITEESITMDSSDVLAIACLSAGFHGNPIPFSSSPFSFTLSEGFKIQFLFGAADKQHNEDIEISDILLIDDYPGKFTQYQKLLRILCKLF